MRRYCGCRSRTTGQADPSHVGAASVRCGGRAGRDGRVAGRSGGVSRTERALLDGCNEFRRPVTAVGAVSAQLRVVLVVLLALAITLQKTNTRSPLFSSILADN